LLKPAAGTVKACRRECKSLPPGMQKPVAPTAKVCHPDRSGGISTSRQQTCRLALSGAIGRRSFGFAQDDRVWGVIGTANSVASTTTDACRRECKSLPSGMQKPVIPTAKVCHPDRSGGISTNRQQTCRLALSGATGRRSFGCAQDDRV